MQTRTLGRNGPKVGAVGYGCMSFGGFYGATDEATSHRALARAWELGITHLDTANVYGKDGISESIIGSFLKKHPHRFTIATKFGNTRQPEKLFDNSPDYMRTCLEASLKRLGVDHIDLYYVHRREKERPIEEVMEALVRLKEEGKIGGIGLSEVSPATFERAVSVHPVMAVQSEYSLWTRLPELGMLQACARHGAALVAFSPLGRGMLTGTPPSAQTIAQSGFLVGNPRFLEPNLSFNKAYVARFADYARQRGWSPTALAIAWTLHRGDHIIPIPGTRTAEHLSECADGAAIVLGETEMAEIEAILPVGFAHGDRYNEAQNLGPERYC